MWLPTEAIHKKLQFSMGLAFYLLADKIFNTSSATGRRICLFPFFMSDLVCLGLLQVLCGLLQPLLIHIWCFPVVPRRHYVIDSFWFIILLMHLFPQLSVSLSKSKCSIYAQFKAKYFSVLIFWCLASCGSQHWWSYMQIELFG